MTVLLGLLASTTTVRGWQGNYASRAVPAGSTAGLVAFPGNLGLPSTQSPGASPGGHVVAFGDLNADKMVDIFLLDDSQTELTAWLWDTSTQLSFRHVY